MNPSSGELPQFELPPPPNESAGSSAGSAAGSEKERAGQPERSAAGPERAPGPSTAPPAAVPATNPLTQVAAQAAQADNIDDNSTTKPTRKPLLEDTDLIEKEWVNRAKRIVENTRDDPRKQSQELTVVKAEYMKQHYGKTIKVEK